MGIVAFAIELDISAKVVAEMLEFELVEQSLFRSHSEKFDSDSELDLVTVVLRNSGLPMAVYSVVASVKVESSLETEMT